MAEMGNNKPRKKKTRSLTMHRHKHDAYWGVVPTGSSVSAQSAPAPVSVSAGSSVSAQSAPAPVSVSAPRPPTSSDPPGLLPPDLIPPDWIRRYAPHGVAPSFVGPPPSGVEDGSMNEVEKLKEAHAKEIEALKERVEIEKGKAELAVAHAARIQEVRDREKDLLRRLELSSNPSSLVSSLNLLKNRPDRVASVVDSPRKKALAPRQKACKAFGQQMRPQQQQQQQQHEDPPKLVAYEDTEDEVEVSGDGVEDGEYDF
ncbi:hypothetical protein MMC22_005389 [Lobaria immixta]|nr:hypothetical protein [Lobaria immixta]